MLNYTWQINKTCWFLKQTTTDFNEISVLLKKMKVQLFLIYSLNSKSYLIWISCTYAQMLISPWMNVLRKYQFKFLKVITDFEILSYFLDVGMLAEMALLFSIFLKRKIVRGLCVQGNYNFIVGDCADIVSYRKNI